MALFRHYMFALIENEQIRPKRNKRNVLVYVWRAEHIYLCWKAFEHFYQRVTWCGTHIMWPFHWYLCQYWLGLWFLVWSEYLFHLKWLNSVEYITTNFFKYIFTYYLFMTVLILTYRNSFSWVFLNPST